MREVIIGTAGHIDHGKTALVKALTGVDTDRLAEEKRRGITIEPGYAYADLSDVVHAGFVDLPGHEKLVKQMLSGAGGITLVLMAVAADEGVMPQTREHLQILQLLGVTHGVIALTRCDLVDAETRALAVEELRGAFAGSFLEDAPVVETSAVSGLGISLLRETLAAVAVALPVPCGDRPFFLPIDRVFTMQGFGTVVTGTVRDGVLRQGETVYLCPAGTPVRVRGLQSGGAEVPVVAAGQRAAANLSLRGTQEVLRGDVLADRVLSSQLLDVRLTALATAERPICHNSRMHLALGTANLLCRVSLLAGETLAPGEQGYAQLRLESSAAARPGDRFVLRFFSPVETVGGGVILDAQPPMLKRTQRLERLHAIDAPLTERLTYELGQMLWDARKLRERYFESSQAEYDVALQSLRESGRIREVGGLLATPALYGEKGRAILKTLALFREANPLSLGLARAVLQKRYPTELLDALCVDSILEERYGRLCIPGDDPLLRSPGAAYAARILAVLGEAEEPIWTLSALAVRVEISVEDCAQVAELLCLAGKMVNIRAQEYISSVRLEQAKEAVARLTARGEGMTLAIYRDEMGISRKYAQILLEYFDEICYTVRGDDNRRFSSQN